MRQFQRHYAALLALMAMIEFGGSHRALKRNVRGASRITSGLAGAVAGPPGDSTEGPAWGPGAWKDVIGRPWVTLSLVGASVTGVRNGGCDFGPDGPFANNLSDFRSTPRFPIIVRRSSTRA